MPRSRWYDPTPGLRAALDDDTDLDGAQVLVPAGYRVVAVNPPLPDANANFNPAGGPISANGPTYYLDEGGSVVIGDIAYLISGYQASQSNPPAGQAYTFLGYILRFNLATLQWLEPVKLPVPPWAPDVPSGDQVLAWRVTDKTTKLASTYPIAPFLADGEKALYEYWIGSATYTIPDVPVVEGWTFAWYDASDAAADTGPLGSELSPGSFTGIPLLLARHADQSIFAETVVNTTKIFGPIVPPTLANDSDGEGVWARSISSASAADYFGFEGGYYGAIGDKIYFGGGDSEVISSYKNGDTDPSASGNWLASYDTVTGEFDWTLADRPREFDYGMFAVADGKLWTYSPLGVDTVPVDGAYPQALMYVYDAAGDAWSSVLGPPPGFNPTSPPGTMWDPSAYPVGDISQGYQVGRRIIWPDIGMAYEIDSGVWIPCADPVTGFEWDSGTTLGSDGKFWLVGYGRDSAHLNDGLGDGNYFGTRLLDPSDLSWSDPPGRVGFYGLADANTQSDGVLPESGHYGDSGYTYAWTTPSGDILFYDGWGIVGALPVTNRLPFMRETQSLLQVGDNKGRTVIQYGANADGSGGAIYDPAGGLILDLGFRPGSNWILFNFSGSFGFSTAAWSGGRSSSGTPGLSSMGALSEDGKDFIFTKRCSFQMSMEVWANATPTNYVYYGITNNGLPGDLSQSALLGAMEDSYSRSPAEAGGIGVLATWPVLTAEPGDSIRMFMSAEDNETMTDAGTTWTIVQIA